MDIQTDYLVNVTLTYKVMAYSNDHAVVVVQDILGNAITNEQLLESTYQSL